MSIKTCDSKEEGLEQLNRLIKRYEKDIDTYRLQSYNETLTRSDFIDPLLMCLGWDVKNESGKTQFLRDVVQEESIDIEDQASKRKPDYTLRAGGIRKLFVEAKKPSVKIQESNETAFQIRRYGWNANLGISIITNFDHFIIYDCRYKPNIDDSFKTARIFVIKFNELVEKFDALYNLVSYKSVIDGSVDDHFPISEIEGETFDDYFLEQIEGWRAELAESAIEKNKELDNGNLNFLIQRLINRIIFLRICEDRAIEKYETIKSITSYEDLKKLFISSDKKYNSGLFSFIEDTLSLEISLESKVLIKIFDELYYPQSPYNFSVIDTSILSQIYEKFLGSKLEIDEGRILSIVELPEVTASNGVVTTPKIIVEKIIKETLQPVINDKSIDEILELRLCDICCGSGIFLINAFEFIEKHLIENFAEELIDREMAIPEANEGIRLKLELKRKVILNTIFGVDINPYATEVSKFSLLLKLLESENEATLAEYKAENRHGILPDLSSNIKCGNSLVDNKFFELYPDALEDNELLLRTNIFDWSEEFSFFKKSKGFDAIFGNPPYVRIQKLVQFQPEEIKYYQSKEHGFEVAKSQTIDKYYVFIQRAINLLNESGCLGYIVPHKFFITTGGESLRKFITDNISTRKIIHFGVTQIFPERSTYTAILILKKDYSKDIEFFKYNKLNFQLLNENVPRGVFNQDYIDKKPWIFLSAETVKIFTEIEDQNTKPLGDLAEIAVGLQTSDDETYIIKPLRESENNWVFEKDGVEWEIEKNICKPFIQDLSFSLFTSINPNSFIIFPYEIVDGKATVLSEENISSNYPKCWDYLLNNKARLSKRSLNGKDPVWYQFGRSQSLTRFHNRPKLIWHVLSTKPTYVYDTDDLQLTGGGNGPYYTLLNNSEYNILYLMGILSHPIFEAMIKSKASEFRGAYYSHGKQFMKNLPIKVLDLANSDEKDLHDRVVTNVEQLINTKSMIQERIGQTKTVFKRRYKLLERELFNTINEIYDLDLKKIKTVLSDEMLNSELLEEE